MTSTQLLGLALITFSGLLIGGGGWPIKLMRHYAYEHIGFLASLIALILVPWFATLTFCPQAIAAYRSIDASILIKSNLFSLAWGVANVLCLMSYLRIGFCLTGGILIGVATPIGVLMPILFKGSGLFSRAPDLWSRAGLTILAGALVMIAGVVFVILSGLGRERVLNASSPTRQRLGAGLVLAVLAGVLSVGNSFSFVYCQDPIVTAMRERGASEMAANFAVWAVGLFAGGMVNVLVPVWLLTRNKTWHVFFAHPRDLALCLFSGVQGCLLFPIFGQGMLELGVLGASVGFGVSQALQMIGGQIVGFFWGEWRGVHGLPRRQIFAAIALLICAVWIMAAGNMLAGR